MRWFGLCALVPLAWGQPLAIAQTRYKIEIEEKQTFTATLTYTTTYPEFQAKEWIAFVAVAPELAGQKKVKTVFDSHPSTAAKDKSVLERNILIARITPKNDEQKSTLAVKVLYTATLYSRNLAVAGPDDKLKVAELTPAERKAALAEFGDYDYKGAAFQKWLKETGYQRRKTEGDVAFARRVFLGLRASHTYTFKLDMDRQASAVCASGKSDCGGLSTLFAAVMRANDIPARSLFGRWATSAKPNEKVSDMEYFQWHVKAEFYAVDVGWVPVDLAASISFDKSGEGLQNFGHDRGDFLTMHIDANFQLDTGTFGKQSHHNLQDPPCWVSGKGKLDRRTDKQNWLVEVKK